MVTDKRQSPATAHDAPRRYPSYSLRPTSRTAFFRCVGTGLAAWLLAGCSSLSPALDMSATGSIMPTPVAVSSSEPVPEGVVPEDWVAARRALAEALAERSASPSVPWENTTTATRGTVTPLAKSDGRESGTCRGFLVSFVRDNNEDWLEGEACSSGAKGWQVAQARLLARS